MQPEPADSHEIFTIGHASLSLSAFVDLLDRYGIALLIDIRRYPGSRYAPQFNPDALGKALEADGIRYQLLPELGGRRRALTDSPNIAWRNPSFRGYADYMETAEFRDGLQRLMELSRDERVAIMCAEAVWWRCHRALVSDALLAQGRQVWHIMSDGTLKLHQLTAPARFVDGLLTYREAEPVVALPKE